MADNLADSWWLGPRSGSGLGRLRHRAGIDALVCHPYAESGTHGHSSQANEDPNARCDTNFAPAANVDAFSNPVSITHAEPNSPTGSNPDAASVPDAVTKPNADSVGVISAAQENHRLTGIAPDSEGLLIL